MDVAPFAGRCITGPNQVSVIVQITDACPECASNQMDIQVHARAAPNHSMCFSWVLAGAATGMHAADSGHACSGQWVCMQRTVGMHADSAPALPRNLPAQAGRCCCCYLRRR